MPVVPQTREPVSAYVAVGANLGDAIASVTQALQDLSGLTQTHVEAVSSLYRSAPYQAEGPAFINAVAHIRTRLNAPDLLVALQAMEQRAGRVRSHVNAPRTLDLDILFYGDAKLQSSYLTLSHPRWMERAFVLLPLQEVAPHKVIPVMLHAVADQQIEKLV
ncbi:MAG: 2-amino-4-hydroxy-6-hydroxymethyldihydropteridine diphosphokinase [Burkholderiales bacterium]|nr:2-amino-4-hydroxy-6-hydroxymethyldihydropteridine diphosphokinase [Burkholderiales bacterium]